jgi:hypothetical protein
VLAIGGLLICVVLLTVAAVARLVRSSNPPRWTTHDGVGQIISLALALRCRSASPVWGPV